MTDSNYVLVDSHAHIYYSDFTDDFDEMLSRAEAAGVGAIVVVGTDVASSRQAVELAEKHPNLYASVGIHPHETAAVTESCYNEIERLAMSSNRVVAIGEIGLDFYRDRSPRDIQKTVFRRFLAMAVKLDKPVIIHDRDAHADVMMILHESGIKKGVLHCFSGDTAMAQQAIEMGFYISIPGTITYPGNSALRDVVSSVNIDHMLIETDCPYLTPVPHRGSKNQPEYVKLVAEKIAELKGLTIEDVARITTKNSCDLFGFNLWDQSSKIAYRIRNSLYLNITNRCSNRCTFCPKFDNFTVKGHNLSLDREPDFDEVMAAIGRPSDIDEIVFCGYGEPLIRLDLVKRISAELKKLAYTIRINTDGQANIVHGRNILPELEGLVDSISVSLNASDRETYNEICTTPYSENGFEGVCEFIRSATHYIPHVTASAVTLPGIDIDACRRLAESLGAEFRAREYAEVG